jgi:membrane protease YdiL (CAAX protease family)
MPMEAAVTHYALPLRRHGITGRPGGLHWQGSTREIAMSMRLQTLFMGPDGLRAGWRLAAFIALWYCGEYALFPLLNLFYTFTDNGFTPGDILVFELGDSLLLLLVSLVLVRLERHRLSWFGLGLGRDVPRLFGVGCLWGFGLVTALLLAAWAGGYASVSGLAEHGAVLWRYLLVWGFGMLLVGVSEELLFRGYALASLTRGIGFWPAAVLLSLFFGAEHLQKPMETAADILNIVLLGLVMCYSVQRTGSLWFAIGFHAAFDFFALAFYGSPNTGNNGLPLEHHLLETHIAGPAWLTGGPQGLEASWLLPLLVAVMFLALRRSYPGDRYPHD